MSSSPLRVFVGWDTRQDILYRVCRYSILRRTRAPVVAAPIKQSELRERGLYERKEDPLASTEFTYTRFFVPYLMNYQGWALYCDCDFLWLSDISQLFALADDRYAVMCVHHDHRPPESSKMEQQAQSIYPRKNWSSMVLYNCAHPKNRALTPEFINRQTGSFLHRFMWLDDSEIGSVPETWNWLEGWCRKPSQGFPKAVHYTRGGPWYEHWREVEYASLWLAEEQDLVMQAIPKD